MPRPWIAWPSRPTPSHRHFRPRLEALEDRALLATAGMLDPTFGTGGRVVTTNAGSVFDAALQDDGKIVVVGTVNGDFSVLRYNANGSLDTTFGTGGRVTTDLGSDTDAAQGVAIQDDGKIVAAGGTRSTTSGVDIAIVRYNTDGSLDTTFGTGGIVRTDFNNMDDVGTDVVLQNNGRIVALARITVGQNSFDLGLAAYNPTDGTLDNTFGTGGRVTTDFGMNDVPTRAVVQADNKIVVVTTDGFTIVRYNANGSLDTNFGTGGRVRTDLNGSANDVVLRPNGQIVVAGFIVDEALTFQFAVAQYNPNGQQDTTFGTNGVVMTGFGGGQDATAEALNLQEDGSIVVGGSAELFTATEARSDFALARYTSTGRLDTSFGNNGRVQTDFNGDIEEIHAILLVPGKVIAAGFVNADVALARYDAPPPMEMPPPPPLTDPVERFVNDLYRDLLNRNADPAGLAFFTGLIKNHRPNRFLTAEENARIARLDVARRIERSQEFRILTVQNLYQNLLFRSPDPTGLNGWVTFLAQGGLAEQVTAFILGSEEYFTRFGDRTNEGFLLSVYEDILSRPIDEGGAAAWGAVLQQGASRTQVAASILASLEADRNEIQDLYGILLNRQPTPVELAARLVAMQQGSPAEELILLLTSSAEYFAQAQAS